MATYKIFVSSNQTELKEERTAVKETILDNPTLRNFFEVFLFEDTPAKGESPATSYLKEVDNSDIYIGIIGREYGVKGKEVKDFLKNRAIKIKVDIPKLPIKDFLVNTLKVVKKEDGELRPTHAGLLFFGKDPSEYIRNKKICAIFHHTLDMEKFGTGIRKMKRLTKEHGLSEPEFCEEGDFFVVRFYGPGDKILDLVPSIPKERQIDLRELGLNTRQIEALRLMVNAKKKITITSYATLFNISDKTAKRDMKDLVKTGFVVKVGHIKGAYFEAK